MFGIGFGELLLIGVVALLVLGPEKLPEAARTLGKLLGTLRKQQDNLKKTFEEEFNKPISDAINNTDSEDKDTTHAELKSNDLELNSNKPAINNEQPSTK